MKQDILSPVSRDDVQEAARRIRQLIRVTPVLTAEVGARPVSLKLENLQVTGSFKFRGALNGVMASADGRHVVAASGGNHGLGVATAAKLMGLPVTIYVPRTTPEVKARRIEAQGAHVVRHGEIYADSEIAARAWAEQIGGNFLHAYDDPAVIAGQGTIGVEIAAQAPWCDSVAAAVGGGGLAAGLSVALDAECLLVAVEPERCDSLHAAFSADGPVDARVESAAASALGASRVGDNAFALLSSRAPRLALASELEIAHARELLWEEFRLAVEPAAAVPFAAWLAGRVPGRHPCLVMCGANADWRPA